MTKAPSPLGASITVSPDAECGVRANGYLPVPVPSASVSEKGGPEFGVDIDDFWVFLERSAQETDDQLQRTQWLEERLCRVVRKHIVDFQIHVDTLRRPLDTYAMWGAASLMLEGWCSGDSFWYFQP